MGEVNKAMGEKLKSLRREMGICRTELCSQLEKKYKRKLGVGHIVLYEDDGFVPDAKILSELADFYGVTIFYLLTERKPNEKCARWVSGEGVARCSKCDKKALFSGIESASARIFLPYQSAFCPHCGAMMDNWDDEKRLEVKISKTFI